MRKLYNEFFHIPKHGKIREKVMIARIAVTIMIVLACLVAMSFSAYAYFSYDIASDANVIKAAHFETKVSIQITDENGKTIDIKPITSNYQSHKVDLDAGTLYTVTITPTEKSTAKTGFVVVTATGCTDTYHTQQLGVDTNTSEGETKFISFELLLTDKTTVYFLAHWGTSSYYDAYKNKGDNEKLYITQGEQIKMVVNGKKNPAADEQKEPDNTMSSNTDSSTTKATESTTTSAAATTKPTVGSATSATSKPSNKVESSTTENASTSLATASSVSTTKTTNSSTTHTTESTTTHATESAKTHATETSDAATSTEKQVVTTDSTETTAPTTSVGTPESKATNSTDSVDGTEKAISENEETAKATLTEVSR